MLTWPTGCHARFGVFIWAGNVERQEVELHKAAAAAAVDVDDTAADTDDTGNSIDDICFYFYETEICAVMVMSTRRWCCLQGSTLYCFGNSMNHALCRPGQQTAVATSSC